MVFANIIRDPVGPKESYGFHAVRVRSCYRSSLRISSDSLTLSKNFNCCLRSDVNRNRLALLLPGITAFADSIDILSTNEFYPRRDISRY